MTNEARQPWFVAWWHKLEPFVAVAVLIIGSVYAVHRYEKLDHTVVPSTDALADN